MDITRKSIVLERTPQLVLAGAGHEIRRSSQNKLTDGGGFPDRAQLSGEPSLAVCPSQISNRKAGDYRRQSYVPTFQAPLNFARPGSVNRNVEPTPSLLSTVTFPP